jgi:hypothetical protein
VKGLGVVPFRVACLANNHSYDYGQEGLESTLKLLQKTGIAPIGAGLTPEQARSAFITTTIDGKRLAIINVSEGEEGAWYHRQSGVAPFDLPDIAQQIATLRKTNDILIVVAHAGREYIPIPPPYIHSAYRLLVEMGADAVIAHHPHVPQGIEIYRGKLIAYSLGNFAFWDPDGHPWQRIGYLLRVNFTGHELQSASLIPYAIHPQGLLLLRDQEKERFLRDLESHSAVLTQTDLVNTIWEVFADHWVQHSMNADLLQVAALLLSEANLLRATRLGFAAHQGIRGKLLRRFWLWIENNIANALPNARLRDKGAAILRNRFDTPAHRELYLTTLRRVLHNEVGNSPDWAVEFMARWYNALPHS